MNEARGNLWDFEADATVITTNGFVKKNGEAVMGRGCAREAATRYPNLPKELGLKIQCDGNHVFLMPIRRGMSLVTFPVKHHWREEADPELIERSLFELVDLADHYNWRQVVMPRPGCGNGRLQWEGDIQMLCDSVLDARFTVVTYA